MLLLDTYPSHVYSSLRKTVYGTISTMNHRFAILIPVLLIAAFLTPNKPVITPVGEEKKADFHTPVFLSGYYLPIRVTSDITIGPENGVIIIPNMSIIERGATLTMKPGTTIAVHEYGGITVRGTLDAIGTKEQPIWFISNEQREENKNWNGIFFENSGSGTIDYSVFHHASPAISCAQQSHISIFHTMFSFGNLELFGSCNV